MPLPREEATPPVTKTNLQFMMQFFSFNWAAKVAIFPAIIKGRKHRLHHFAEKITTFAPTYEGKAICRAGNGEESPDRTGHPAAESADGSNLIPTVTEKNRLRSVPSPRFGRSAGKGENVGQEPTTAVSDAGRVRRQGLQDQIYWQTRAARPMPGGRLRR